MKAKDLKSMGEIELKDKLAELQKELVKFNAQIATKTALKNPAHVGNVKKGIARIKGLLNQKSLGKKQKTEAEARNE